MTVALLALMMAAQAAGNGAVPEAAPGRAVATVSAPVEIVVYSDFKCPFCAMFAQTIRELQLGPGRIQIGEPLFTFSGVLTGVPPYTGAEEPLLPKA